MERGKHRHSSVSQVQELVMRQARDKYAFPTERHQSVWHLCIGRSNSTATLDVFFVKVPSDVSRVQDFGVIIGTGKEG